MGFVIQSSSDKQVLSGLCLFFYHDHRSVISTWGNLRRPCSTDTSSRNSGSASSRSGGTTGSRGSGGTTGSSSISIGWLLSYNNPYLLNCKTYLHTFSFLYSNYKVY